jgi:hypothetical protein
MLKPVTRFERALAAKIAVEISAELIVEEVRYLKWRQ